MPEPRPHKVSQLSEVVVRAQYSVVPEPVVPEPVVLEPVVLEPVVPEPVVPEPVVPEPVVTEPVVTEPVVLGPVEAPAQGQMRRRSDWPLASAHADEG